MLCSDQKNCEHCASNYHSFFSDLPLAESGVLHLEKKTVAFKKGELIFQEGSRPRGLFCIQEGKVKIVQTGPDGKEIILHLANNANIMGHRAILGNDTYSCSAYAIEDCTVCFIPRNTFIELVEKNSKLAFQIIQLLARELKESEEKTTIIAQSTSREKIIKSLILLADCYGFEEDNKTLNVIVSREELANMSGTTRETATRILSELKEEGRIELIRKKIKFIQSISVYS